MNSDKYFNLEPNALYVTHEPINSLDIFTNMCMQLIAQATQEDVYIVLEDPVSSIQSSYVGVLMSCLYLAKHTGKKLHIKCNENLQKWIKIVDGECLLEFVD